MEKLALCGPPYYKCLNIKLIETFQLFPNQNLFESMLKGVAYLEGVNIWIYVHAILKFGGKICCFKKEKVCPILSQVPHLIL